MIAALSFLLDYEKIEGADDSDDSSSEDELTPQKRQVVLSKEAIYKDIALSGVVKCSEVPTSYPPHDFLSFCYSCEKKLEGEDIYMYRGEKAFCSWSCRSQEILIEEAMEKTNNNSTRNSSNPTAARNSMRPGCSLMHKGAVIAFFYSHYTHD